MYKIEKENGEIIEINTLKELDSFYSEARKLLKPEGSRAGNGEGSLYFLQKEQKWEFAYYALGKRKKIKQTKKESKTEFMKRVNKIRYSLDTGTYIEKTQETVSTILDSYLEQKWKDGLLKPSSYKRNSDTLRELKEVCKDFVDIPIANVKVSMVEAAKEGLREYSNSSISKIWNLLYSAFKIAYSRRLIPFNIMDDYSLAKPKSTKTNKKIEALTAQEEQKLISILDNEESSSRYALLTKLQLKTGMRIGEVLALKTEDFDFEKDTIHVHATITQDENMKLIYQANTKTYDISQDVDKGERYIPMSLEVKALAKEIIKNMTPNINKFVFYDTKGMMGRSQVNSWLKRINEKYHISAATLHSHVLRHTFVTRMIEQGMNLRAVQSIVGHVKGSSLTNDVYTSASLDFVKSEVEKMGQFVGQ